MKASTLERIETRDSLARELARVRRRWRMRRVLQGAAVALAAIVLGSLIAIVTMDLTLFDPVVVSFSRWAVYVLATALALVLIALRALRPVPDPAVAMYLESRLPELDALMLSSVEVEPLLDAQGRAEPLGTSPDLARQLIREASRICTSSPRVLTLERRALRRAALCIVALLALTGTLLLFGPSGWRHAAALLVSPREPPREASPYAIDVVPGDASILSGEDLRIVATARGFEADTLFLVTRPEGATDWRRETLAPLADGNGFGGYRFDLRRSFDYFVEGRGLRSADYRIDVAHRPLASRIDLLYQFPRSTGRAPELVEDGGDISAVIGTRVELRIVPSAPTPAGRLVIDGDEHVDLVADGSGALRATIEVRRDARYRVELEAPGHGLAAASQEHAIVAHADTLPNVAMVGPGRDLRVTRIQEVELEARADDDVAVRELEMVFSVNGGPDQVVSLDADGAPSATRRGRLRLSLEQRELEPGDLIAYYARARDAAQVPARQVSTDIFFLEVRPFETVYRRARAGGGGGGGAAQEETLTAQQRSVVVALFKLVRDRPSLASEEFAERVATMGGAQSRIRTRVDAIVRRLGARSIVEMNPGYRKMAEELPRAAKAMSQVEALLSARDVDQALPAARVALLHLQRADSAFREVQVAQSRQAGGDATANDLANLFQLEMDRFRNPYEDLRRGDWRRPEQRRDETLRKLRELARRQQRELERARASSSSTRGGADSQRALAEEVDRLVRELERLSRRRPSEELRASLSELESAARAMRRSAQDANPGASAEALERLREARRLLDSEPTGRLARDTQRAARRAGALAETQDAIAQAVEQKPEAGKASAGESARIASRKRALADEVEDLQAELDRLAAGARREQQRNAARALEGAAGSLRNETLAERLRDSVSGLSREQADQAQAERDLARSLRALRDRLDAASRLFGETDRARLASIVDQLRGTLPGLERERERLEERARRGSRLAAGGSQVGLDSADLADAQRALVQRAQGLGGLYDALAGDPALAGELENLLGALNAARGAEVENADALAQRQADLLAALKQIERALRVRLGEPPASASAVHRTEPASEVRARVERYYRALSESR